MAQLIISAAGAAIGFAVGGPTGAQIGWAVGSMVGASINRPKVQGPRLQDLKVGSSQYGTPIPRVYGSPRVPGQIWWASDKREIASTSGGKGGGPEVTSYSYEVDLLIGLCEGANVAVRRIWSNGKIVYNLSDDADAETILASENSDLWTRLTVYGGGTQQLPDAVYEAAVQTANAIAYRNRVYVFIEALQLGVTGQLPNLTFELGRVEVDGGGLTMDFDDLQDLEAILEFYNAGAGDLGSIGPDYGAIYTEDILAAKSVLFGGSGDFKNNPSGIFTCYLYTSSGRINVPGGFELGLSFYYSTTTFDGYAYIYDGENGTGNLLASAYLEPLGTFAGQFEGLFENWRLVGMPFVGVAKSVVFTGTANQIGFDDITLGYDATAAGTATPTLAEVISDICEQAAIGSAQIDVTALEGSPTQLVEALAITQISTARATLEQLATAYFVETTLRDKLYFRPRAESPVADIPFADLAAGSDTPSAEPLALTIANDLELPPQVAVTYANLLDDHQQGTEYSDRIISGQAATQTIELAMGLTPAEAKGIADAIVVDAYSSRTSTTVSLPLEYAHLEAGDVVTVRDDAAAAYRLRLVRKREEGGLLQFEAVLDDQTALTSLQITDETQVPSGTVTTPGSTVFEPLDIPILRDTDDGPGYYVAARGSTTNWPGAQIQSSINDTDFTTVAEVNESAVFGTASTTLATYTGVGFDERNSVTVDVGNGELSSSTRAAMLTDETINSMVIGSEVLRFRDATLSSPGVYVLTGLLRGQRGTEWAIGTHGASERVALLRTSGLRRVATSSSDIQQTRYLRGVTFGGIASDATSEAFTDTGEAVRPFSPVDARTSLASDGTLVIDWKRRTRFTTNLTGPGGISAPLDYTFQPLFTSSFFTGWETVPTGNRPAFIVRLYGDAARTQLIRTYYADSTAVTYPVADISADFAESPSLYEDGVLYAAITHLSAFANIESAPLYATLNPLQ